MPPELGNCAPVWAPRNPEPADDVLWNLAAGGLVEEIAILADELLRLDACGSVIATAVMVNLLVRNEESHAAAIVPAASAAGGAGRKAVQRRIQSASGDRRGRTRPPPPDRAPAESGPIAHRIWSGGPATTRAGRSGGGAPRPI